MCLRCQVGDFVTKNPPAQTTHLLTQLLFTVKPQAITDEIANLAHNAQHLRAELASGNPHIDTEKAAETLKQTGYIQDSLRLMLTFRDSLARCARSHGCQAPPETAVATDDHHPYPSAQQLNALISWSKHEKPPIR